MTRSRRNRSLTKLKNSRKLIEIASHQDVARARQAGYGLAAEILFRESDCVKFATAISELTRNVINYARTGTCEINARSFGATWRLEALVTDGGPGIDNIDVAMTHGYTTGNGLGVGLSGTRELVDEFEISSSPSGTTVKIALVR